MKLNYYEVLGVDRGASDVEIREKFRKLARENHPDRYSDADKVEAEKKFQTLTEAVNVLTNPTRRKAHDAELQSGLAKATTDPTQVAKVYVAHGVKAYKDGDYVAARDNFDMATKHNPQDAKAWHYLSLACAKIPSSARLAVQAIETAVQKEPYNPTYLKDAGMLCKRAGLTAKAERYLEEALQWDSENREIRAALTELRQGRDAKESGKGLLDSLFKKN
jgi:curved DNA-binding protein CbpA